MKSEIIVIIVAGICIAGTFGVTYYYLENEKDTEIQNIKSEYQNLDANYHNYIKQINKGFEKYYGAALNRGFAKAYYDEAITYYSESTFVWGKIYADFAKTYYSYASNNWRDAKTFFNASMNYVTSNNTKKLTQLWINLSELDAQINSEIYDACEFLALACDFYDKGNNTMGDIEIEKMNEHMEIYDELVEDGFVLWSEMDELLDDFY